MGRRAPTLRGVGVGAVAPPQQQQQLPKLAADGAPPGLIATLECAHRECRDLLRAVAKVLVDARRVLLLQASEAAAEARDDGSGASTVERTQLSCEEFCCSPHRPRRRNDVRRWRS
jgi:hypothetical protein